MQRKHIIYTVILLILIALGFVFLQGNNSEDVQEASALQGILGVLSVETVDKEERDNSQEASLIDENKSILAQNNLTQTYTNEKFGFSFKYPEGFTVGSFTEGEGDIILLQKTKQAQETSQDIQFYVALFDETGPITPERIHQDLPELEIKNPLQVVIGDGSIEALIFQSSEEQFGKAREVWFIQNGQLYQVTTNIGNDRLIGLVLESLRFTP